MSDTTQNLGLTLPDENDFYSVGVTNSNMNIIDNAFGNISQDVAQQSSLQSLISTVGSTSDTGGTSSTGTSMAKLNTLLKNGLPITETTISSSIYAGTTELINIQGTGNLLGFYSSISGREITDFTATLHFEINNTNIWTCTYNNTSTSYFCYGYAFIGISEYSCSYYYSSTNYGFQTFAPFYKIPSDKCDWAKLNFGGADTETLAYINGNTRKARYCFITKELPFQNIKVYVNAESEDASKYFSATTSLAYILD